MARRNKVRRTNNDLQNITQKTKDRVTRTPLKTGSELGYSGGVSFSCKRWHWVGSMGGYLD
jgi:hypothetical protein